MEKKSSHPINYENNIVYDDESSDCQNNLVCDFGDLEKTSPATLGEPEVIACKEYYCEKCDYFTKKNSDFIKHQNTKKHNAKSDVDHNLKNQCGFCDKQYSSASNLWKHKQKCKMNEIKKDSINKTLLEGKKANSSLTNEMVIELIKQNKELQNVLVEQSAAIMEQSAALMQQNNKLVEITAKGSTHIQNMTNNTTNNNQFNINFFLNEQCKNAVSIIDFVQSLQVQIQDLEKTGKLGYVEGISSIFLKGLRELNVYERPIHCTDLKRETVYVKDKDSWEKDDGEKGKLKLAIKQIARKNLRTLPKWQLENPDFVTLDTRENNEYLKIARNSLGGEDDEEEQKFTEKIIRNVLKDVLIDKK